MRIEDFNAKQIATLIEEAKDIAVIASKQSGSDGFCAAVGLYNLLKANDKKVRFIYPSKMPNECSHLIDQNAITSNIAQREVEVSIDYSGTPAAKAHYHTDQDVLTVRIGPVHRKFDAKKRVKTKITGFDFDLVFTVGIQQKRDLGTAYDSLKDELDHAKVVNLDTSKRNTRFGTINVVDVQSEKLSMLIYSNSALWGIRPSRDAAQALLTGITLDNGS